MSLGRTANLVNISAQKRLALLVNRYCQPAEYAAVGDSYNRLKPTRGNKSVFQMEAALRRGKLSLAEDVASVLMQQYGKEKAQAYAQARYVAGLTEEIYCEAVGRGSPAYGYARISEDRFQDELTRALVASCYRIYVQVAVDYYRRPSSISYEHISKIFADANDVKAWVYGALSFYAQIADQNTLTLLFIRAHGSEGQVDVFPYKELLDKLDAIAGKKVVIVFACYSGSLHQAISRRGTAGNYIALTSTRADCLGQNWNEDSLLEDLTDRIIREDRPLSSFGSGRSYAETGKRTFASLHIPFDVVL